MRGFNNGTPGQDGRRNIVRYDSPEFGGFVASASWGEDDLWDTSLTYKGEIHDFKLIGKIGYGESTDPACNGNCGGPIGDFKCTWWGAAATAMHQPTGLYLYGGYGQQTIELAAGRLDDTSTTYSCSPASSASGIRSARPPSSASTARMTPAPARLQRCERRRHVNTRGADLTSTPAASCRTSRPRRWISTSSTATPKATTSSTARRQRSSIDDFDMVISGARIQF